MAAEKVSIIKTQIAIIGAGPIGLSMAIEAQKAGIEYVVIDKGSLTDGIRRWPNNMTYFSTPEKISIGDLPFPTTGVRPTRDESLEYYLSVHQHYGINSLLYHKVIETNQGATGYELKTDKGPTVQADYVVFATGYYDLPIRPKIKGIELPHVSFYYEGPYAYSTLNVVVVGAGNSGTETALDLYRHAATVSLIHRSSDIKSNVKPWIKPDILNRLKKNEISPYFDSELHEIDREFVYGTNNKIGKTFKIPADQVFIHCGFLPSLLLPKQLGVSFNNKLVPSHSPNTFETNVPGVFIIGTATAGEAIGEVFIENGKKHPKNVIKRIQEINCDV